MLTDSATAISLDESTKSLSILQRWEKIFNTRETAQGFINQNPKVQPSEDKYEK